MAMLHLYCLIILLICGVSYAKKCNNIEGLEGCACQMSDSGEVIGLKELTQNDTEKRIPRFQVADKIKKGWFFAYHPCGTFDMFLNETNPKPGYQACNASTAARYSHTSVNQCYGLGDLEGSFFTVEDDYKYPVVSNITVTYRNMTSVGKKGVVISLICDHGMSVEESEFVYINVTLGVEDTYYFQLTSKCACPGGCSSDIPVPVPTTLAPFNTTFEPFNTTSTPFNTTFEPFNTTSTPFNTTSAPSESVCLLPVNGLIQIMLMLTFFAVFGVLNT